MVSEGRKMFSCRLSLAEYEILTDILNVVDDSSCEFLQNKFRKLLQLLGDRLYMGNAGFLKLRLGDGEMSEKELEELSKPLDSDLYDMIDR